MIPIISESQKGAEVDEGNRSPGAEVAHRVQMLFDRLSPASKEAALKVLGEEIARRCLNFTGEK